MMEKLTNQQEIGNGAKEQQKRIKVFCDYFGTIDKLVTTATTGHKDFFKALADMETAYNAKVDITVVTSTKKDTDEITRGNPTKVFNFAKSFSFAFNEMDDRLTDLRCPGGLYSGDIRAKTNKWNTDVVDAIKTDRLGLKIANKQAMVKEYCEKFESDEKSVLFNVYVGDDNTGDNNRNGTHVSEEGIDYDMAQGHVQGEYYKGKPCVFIHVGAKANENKSFIYKNGISDTSAFKNKNIRENFNGVADGLNIIKTLAKNNQLELPSKANTIDDK